MYRVIGIAAVASLLLALPSAGFAQAKKGDKEVSISGNVSTSFAQQVGGGLGGTSESSGNAFLGFGVFLTDRVQFGVAPSLTVMTGLDGGVRSSLGGATNLQFYFGAQESKVKPYVGYSLNISSFTTGEGGSLADNMYNSGVFGVKNYFSERAAIDFNGSYGLSVTDPGNERRLDFRVGLTYLF